MLSNAIRTETEPSSADLVDAVVVAVGDQEAAPVGLEARTARPSRTKKSVVGGFALAKLPMSATSVNVLGPSTR